MRTAILLEAEADPDPPFAIRDNQLGGFRLRVDGHPDVRLASLHPDEHGRLAVRKHIELHLARSLIPSDVQSAATTGLDLRDDVTFFGPRTQKHEGGRAVLFVPAY